MKIGLSMFDAGWGGIQIQTLNHIRYSADSNEFYIFADSPGEMSDIFLQEKKVKEIIYCHDHEIAYNCANRGIQVFLHHTVNHTPRLSINDLNRVGIPVVVFHHCAGKPLYDSSLAQAIITTSENNIKIIRQNPSFKNKKIHKIPLSLDLSKFTPSAEGWKIREKYGISRGFVIGRVGRLEPGKCPEDFIRVAGKMFETNPALFFVVGGALSIFQSQDYLSGLKKLAKEYGLEDHILFTGSLTEQDKVDLISTFDLYLYPTTWEGYCMAFLESMALGKPILTYDNFANSETIGEAGIAVETGNIKEMIDAADALIQDDKRREEMGKKGRELVVSRNSPVIFASRIDEVLESVALKTPRVIIEDKIKLLLVGWGLPDEMWSIPEFLQLKYFKKAGLNVDFRCVTESGMAEYEGTKIIRSSEFKEPEELPDIILTHHIENPLSDPAIKYGNDNDIPIMMSIHSITKNCDPLIGKVNRFVLFSEKERQIRNNIPDNKIVIIPNGIEVSRYRNSSEEFGLQKGQGKKNILFVGQLFDFKGIYRIVETALMLSKCRMDFCFHIVSHVIGEYENLLQQVVSKGLSEFVKIYPSKHSERSFEELLDFYAGCDIFFLPTKEDTYPTTLLEAMASSKPCIATTVGGIPEIIDHEVTGYHLDSKFKVNFAVSRLNLLLNDSELCGRMGEMGRRKIESKNNIEVQIKRYIEVFKELIHG